MHLTVLTHGMWGRTADFDYIVNKLEQQNYSEYIVGMDLNEFSTSENVVYRCTTNQGYHTYDGIDVCGFRLANEIQSVLHLFSEHELEITELSLVGYSMGALIVRYAVGLLEARKVFAVVKPRVLVATCGPHVGVNILGNSIAARVYNFIGSWSMARTSRQAFLTDSDQVHQKPLLLLMTQPKTPWVVGLARFEKRVLYANVLNDRRCDFYTSAAEPTNPFVNRNLRQVSQIFIPGYEQVVIKGGANALGAMSNARIEPIDQQSTLSSKLTLGVKLCLAPLWFAAFLVNATFQFVHSKFRTRGIYVDKLDAAFEELKAGLPDPDSGLTPLMKQIMDQFNNGGWEKYFLHMPSTKLAHSAAIMKQDRPEWAQGKPAVDHLIKVLTSGLALV